MAGKQQPIRTCIVTGEKLPKTELVRLVRVKDDQGNHRVEVDLRNRKQGRGANIKPSLDLLQKAIQSGRIERALKLESPLSEEDVERLTQEFADALDEKAFRPKANQKVRYKVSKKEFQSKLEN